jgi:hypothetical protein
LLYPIEKNIPSHFAGKQVSIAHTLGKDIADVIVGDKMLHPEGDPSSKRAQQFLKSTQALLDSTILL